MLICDTEINQSDCKLHKWTSCQSKGANRRATAKINPICWCLFANGYRLFHIRTSDTDCVILVRWYPLVSVLSGGEVWACSKLSNKWYPNVATGPLTNLKQMRIMFSWRRAMGGSRGMTGGPDPMPPENLQKYRDSQQYWSRSPEKSQSSTHSKIWYLIVSVPDLFTLT